MYFKAIYVLYPRIGDIISPNVVKFIYTLSITLFPHGGVYIPWLLSIDEERSDEDILITYGGIYSYTCELTSKQNV